MLRDLQVTDPNPSKMAPRGRFPIYVWSHKGDVAPMTKEGKDTTGFMKVKATAGWR